MMPRDSIRRLNWQQYRQLFAALALCAAAAGHAAADEPIERQTLFAADTHGYHTFRIPSLIATPGGTAIAFCEGRKQSTSDAGDIDLVMRASNDGGKTWNPPRVIWDDGANTCGNPCPVIDLATGAVHLLLTHNRGDDAESEIVGGTAQGSRTVWQMTSTDDGATWSPPREITPQVKRDHWTWYATGPGVGIQTSAGRLLIPCDHTTAGDRAMCSHVIYSDDHGQRWQIGGVVGPRLNECQIAELSDKSLLLNMRSYHKQGCRFASKSDDGGLTWTVPEPDRALIEPVCQASLLRWSPGDAADRRLLFANPASLKRERLTARLSRDDGATWPLSRVLHTGLAAYSCLARLKNNQVACLYECGNESPYQRIELATFDLDWFDERH